MANTRETKEFVEIVSIPAANTRLPQEYVEIVSVPATNTRLAQAYVEIVATVTADPLPPITPPIDEIPFTASSLVSDVWSSM